MLPFNSFAWSLFDFYSPIMKANWYFFIRAMYEQAIKETFKKGFAKTWFKETIFIELSSLLLSSKEEVFNKYSS